MDKTLGVLSANKEIRNAHIQRNIAKYAMYDAPLSPALGDYYEIYTRPLASLTNGDSLFDYTHGLKNRYSEEISERYLSGNIEGHSVYTSDGPVFKNYWTGDYNNYLDYVMAVYGHEHAPIRFIEGLLSLSFMDEAIRLSAPAVIRDIAPTLSIAGVVKTNHNNFSGTDTRLGLITNQMYARSLYDGAVYNSDRQATSSYVKSVITPSMVYKYGNTLNNINNLPNLFAPNHSEGKIIDDYSQDVEIFDSLKEIIDLNTVNLYDVLKNNKSQDFIGWNGSAYIKSGTTDYYGDDTGEYVKHSSTTLYTNRGKVVNAIGEDISEFRNSDTRAPGNAINGFYDGKIRHIVYEDKGHSIEMPFKPNFENTQFDEFRSVDDKINSGTDNSTLADKSLLSKTNQIFKEHKIHTIYGEHRVRNGLGMGKFGDKSDKKTTTTDTAKSGYGKSRGRNLLKKDPSDPNGKVNGYDNPYCRVWTYHHQYDRVNKMVRPFTDPKTGKVMDLREVQDLNDNYRSFIYTGKDKDGGPTGLKGSDYLADNTVLRKTGFVNITPSLSDKTDIKKCMFSIENLAWKDVPENREDILSKEQRGPNGGRIMWFPPYDINFQENVNAQWEGNTFIGRGEKVYTYSNTDRNGTLSFTLLIDHPAILNDLHNESGNENPSYYDSETTEDRSKDMEGDILRFFAGCMPLKYRKKRDEITLEDEQQLEKQKPKEERIKIYVFFPNDYSGHMTIKPKDSGQDRQVGCDTDFIEYMLCGKNAGIPEGNNGNGYEMLCDGSDGSGISEGEGYKLNDDEIIRACKDYSVSYRECNNDYEGITGRTRKYENGVVINISKEQDKNERIFQYRVDYDLRQNGLYVGNNISNYKDTKSFGLNSSIDVVTNTEQGNKQSATYTFAEFCCALMKLKGEGNYDDKLYNKSLGYVATAIGADRAKERINSLCSILSRDRQFTTIKINGGATKQDPSRSDMLGNRRCGTLKSLFLDAYSFRANSTKEEEKINIIINETPEVNELKYDKKLISTIDPKRERFAVIDIGYIVSEEKKVSDKNEPALSNKHKGLVYKLYQLMLERSGILKEYNNITPLWDEFFKWFESETEDTKAIKEYFTDECLEDIFNKETPFDEVKYVDLFFFTILSFSNEIYKNSNVTINDISGNTDSTGCTFSGYSRTLELSNSTSNDEHNEEFENVLAVVNDMVYIEQLGDDIKKTEKNIADIQTRYDEQSAEISVIEGNMVRLSNELADIDPTENSTAYDAKLEELKNVTQQRLDESQNLWSIKEALDKENARLSFNISKRISAIGLKTRGFKKKLDALGLARKTYVNDGKGLLDLECDVYNNLIDEIGRLEQELIKITEGTDPKSTRINSVILKIKTKKNTLKTTNKLIESYQEKVDKIDNKIKEVWEEYKDKINKIKIASYRNMTYAIRSIISNSDANLYDSLKLTKTEIDSMTGYTYSDEDMFVNPLFYYNTITTGLISAFEEGKEAPYKDNVYYKFWPIYAIYLLVRWIEDDICEEMDSGVNDGSKQTDELNELFKYTIDSLFENKNMDTAIEIMTLLVAKKRISEVNKEKFNIDGVSCTTLIDTTKLQELSGVTKFIEYSGSTSGSDMLDRNKLSVEAVKEIDERLSVLSKGLKSKAEKMRDDANNNDNGNTNISENNGSNNEDEVNDNSANTVYKREALRTKNYRYETESEYFSKLKEDDPIIWKKIKDKIKYFDPAFHSMSPEGFNARLTFLQQCTRQGHTLEQRNSSDNYTQTANNLAFGRMPVCILRLGDFIYSRIIINTMSISYGDGGIQWDLNPEGAGVQPMMAKISMGITILGGQSLEGPVSRLQNAVTFNYYANAGVYDDRADRAKPAYGYDAIEWTENGENKKGNKRIFYDTVEAAESNIRNGEIKVKNAEGPVHMTNHYHVWTPFQKDN